MLSVKTAPRRLAITALLVSIFGLGLVADAGATKTASATNTISRCSGPPRAQPRWSSHQRPNRLRRRPRRSNPRPLQALAAQSSAQSSAAQSSLIQSSATQSSAARGSGAGAVAWGDNYHGQLGQIFKDNFELSPVPVEGVYGITEIAAGASFDLALLGNGNVISWGGNQYGELGDDSRMANWEEGYGHVAVREWSFGAKGPSEFPELTGVKQIAAGGVHGLALMKDGTVKAWGSNQYGQLGDGKQGFESLTNVNQRVARTVEWPAVNKTEKIVKNGAEKSRTIKVAAGKLSNILAVAIGGRSDYALTSEHTVLAWGSNTEGQLGLGLTEPGPEGCETEVAHFPRSEACSTVPRSVEWINPRTRKKETLKEVKTVLAGALSAYALLENGHVVSWGGNREGQLGTGAPTVPPHSSELPPEEVRLNDGKEGMSGEALSGVVEIAAGYDDVLARVQKAGSEQVLGWGAAGQGALTLETRRAPVVNCRNEPPAKQEAPEAIACVRKATPIPRLQALHPQELAAGNAYGLALSAGKVYAWGRNERGQLGNGKLPQNAENPTTGKNIREPGYPEPTKVSGFGRVSAIAAGNTEAVALVENAAERPEAPVSVRPERLALSFGWSPRTASGAEVIGQKLNYRIATRKSEFPSAEEGSDPAEEVGAPINNPGEPPAITELEEGEAPAVEAKHNILKVARGGWSGARPIAFEYQWERCNAEGSACVKVDRQGHECAGVGCPSEYSGQTLVKEDLGHTLQATVIANGPEGQGMATTGLSETVVLEEGETERMTEIGKSELTNPFRIARTLERLPLTEVQKQKNEHKHREVARELEAVSYELKLTTREDLAGQIRPGLTRVMVATPLPAGR